MKTVAIVQARVGSTRLPNKVLREVGGMPIIGLLLERLSRARTLQQIVVAIPDAAGNAPLASYVRGLGYTVYEGSEADVLDRFYQAAKLVSADNVVRITGDCPLVDPALVDQVINAFVDGSADYVTNTQPPTYPDGLDIEVFSFAALERAWREATTKPQREHVTPYLRESTGFTRANITNTRDFSDQRWTVDEPQDLEVVRRVVEFFAPRRDFGWMEVIALRDQQPDLFMTNKDIQRNQGMELGAGQKLWNRAKRVIPGGGMLLSKRAEMFLPDRWPAYFSRAKGCRVWDLDGRELIDMSTMGIGTNTLGYGHPEVDDAVRKTIDAGNMSTLNCPEEVYLVERLIELHPWAAMGRLARTGGEANAVGIRIARAAAGKSVVAFCGYHGWHDWYLAANLGDGHTLAGHLLPGLEPNGVPVGLRGSIVPFHYNNYAELTSVVEQRDVGVIVMEVSRNMGPADGFLQKVRELATRKGIVLVFDECTSGFRQTFGGMHKLYGVEPDMAMFGKALGNGYAITAVIGRREVMEAGQGTFISSTFWTERIGPSAALKTLEVMERERSWEQITRIGTTMGERWKALAAAHGLDITVSGFPAITSFRFASPNHLKYRTLITQEMLKRGYLATNALYASIAHPPEMDGYFEALDPIFATIKECESGRSVDELLEGPVCHSGFSRLN